MSPVAKTQVRAIYASRGFVRKASAPNAAFGRKLVSETWELLP